jgi:hypothetical protein
MKNRATFHCLSFCVPYKQQATNIEIKYIPLHNAPQYWGVREDLCNQYDNLPFYKKRKVTMVITALVSVIKMTVKQLGKCILH